MRNPLPRPVEQAIAAGLLFAALWLWLSAERSRAAEAAVADRIIREATASAAQWKAQTVAALSRVARDTVTITRTAARTDTLRDSVLVHLTDTVRVREYVRAADSTIRACRDLVTDCGTFRIAAESTIAAEHARGDAWRAKYQATRPRWYDRCGLNGGYAIVKDGTTVHAGPAVAFSCRVWP